MISELAW